jgi:hypothetical protein
VGRSHTPGPRCGAQCRGRLRCTVGTSTTAAAYYPGGVQVLNAECLVAVAACYGSGVMWSMVWLVGTVYLVYVHIIIYNNI